MNVNEIITKIANKELSIKQLSEKYGKSDRTIQSKIKSLGYQWNAKAGHYEYKGTSPEPINIEFDSLFTNKAPKKQKQKPSASNMKSERKQKDNDNVNKINNDPDMIDRLLNASKKKSERTYRGFYFDPEILEVIDQASNKSDLINEVCRKVFKEKGLL